MEDEVGRKLRQKKLSQDLIDAWKNRKVIPELQPIERKRYLATIYPHYILEKAFKRVNAVGSATAMIGVLNSPNELSIANIGDSGFLVIRFKNGEPYCPYKSKEQQHSFNIPYQLSQLPTKVDLEILRRRGKLSEMQKLKNVLRKKNNVCQDSPDNADEYVVELKDGDIIISATDGVFDNLFQHEMLSIVSEFRKEYGDKLTTQA